MKVGGFRKAALCDVGVPFLRECEELFSTALNKDTMAVSSVFMERSAWLDSAIMGALADVPLPWPIHLMELVEQELERSMWITENAYWLRLHDGTLKPLGRFAIKLTIAEPSTPT